MAMVDMILQEPDELTHNCLLLLYIWYLRIVRVCTYMSSPYICTIAVPVCVWVLLFIRTCMTLFTEVFYVPYCAVCLCTMQVCV